MNNIKNIFLLGIVSLGMMGLISLPLFAQGEKVRNPEEGGIVLKVENDTTYELLFAMTILTGVLPEAVPSDLHLKDIPGGRYVPDAISSFFRDEKVVVAEAPAKTKTEIGFISMKDEDVYRFGIPETSSGKLTITGRKVVNVDGKELEEEWPKGEVIVIRFKYERDEDGKKVIRKKYQGVIEPFLVKDRNNGKTRTVRINWFLEWDEDEENNGAGSAWKIILKESDTGTGFRPKKGVKKEL